MYYLAAPYTLYPFGPHASFIRVSAKACDLLSAGVEVFSPITHFHPMALYGGVPMTDWEFWVRACQPFVDAAEGMILYQMPGWGSSLGIKAEFGQFWDTGRPIRLLPLDTSFRGLTFLEVCLHDIRR